MKLAAALRAIELLQEHPEWIAGLQARALAARERLGALPDGPGLGAHPDPDSIRSLAEA